MGGPAIRREHSREGLGYETDLTDAERTAIEPGEDVAAFMVFPDPA